jgi:hypothetical protein
MDWLRSWVQTPEQRCTEAVQKILTAGELSDSEWSTFHGDVVKDEIPNSLIAGLPSLLEALQGREAEGRSSPVTRCRLLTVISLAATNPAHAAALVENDAVKEVYAQWQKDTDVGIIVEVLAALRNLVLHPQGAEAFMTTDGLDRMFTELDRGALSSKLEAKVHMLSAITNLAARNEFAAFQIGRTHVQPLINKFASQLNRFAISAAYNVMLWENARQIVKSAKGTEIKDALVKALGDIVLESCEGKSIEYCTAARMVQFVETDASGEGYKPAKFPWQSQPIFSGGELEQ